MAQRRNRTTCSLLRKSPEVAEMLDRPSIEHITVLCRRPDGRTYMTPLEAGAAESVMLPSDVGPDRPGPAPSVCRRGDKVLAILHSHPALADVEQVRRGRRKIPQRVLSVPSVEDFEHSIVRRAPSMCVLEAGKRELSCYDVRPLLGMRARRGFRSTSRYLRRVSEGNGDGWPSYLASRRTCSVKV